MKTLLRFPYAALSGVLLTAGFALAQYAPQDSYQDPEPYQYQDEYRERDVPADPPGRVARMQYARGEVFLQPGGVDDWVDVSLNRPLTTGDRIWTDRRSLAELNIGSSVLRVSNETSLQFLNLTDDLAQIELDQGTLHLSVRYLEENEIVEVDTPNVAFIVYEPGEYRFDVWPDSDETSIQIRHGAGEASGRNTSMLLSSGRRYLFANGHSLRYQVESLMPPDRFEEWCARREDEQLSSPSAQYVARGTIGYETLDGYGAWRPVPVYGTVWFPDVYAGWAPYRYGHWAWIEPWGWTWVDDAPWGFAPFHYGRWVSVRGRWGWIPGPVAVRPVYAPAMVAWIGGTPGFSVSIGIGVGGVGWVPLGWRDPYIPYYHVSRNYAHRVNVANSRQVNVTIVNNYYGTRDARVRDRTIRTVRYENARVKGAMTAVSGDVFSSGRPVGKGAVIVSPKQAARVRFSTESSVVPTRNAVLGGRQPAREPKGWVAPRRVVAKTPPPPPQVRFDQQKPLLEKSKGRPLTMEEREHIRSSKPESAIRRGRPTEVIPSAGAGRGTERPERAPRVLGGAATETPSARPERRPDRIQPQERPEERPERRQGVAPQERPQARPEPDSNRGRGSMPEAAPGRGHSVAPQARPEPESNRGRGSMPEAAPERGPSFVPQEKPQARPEPDSNRGRGSMPEAAPERRQAPGTLGGAPPSTPQRREAAPDRAPDWGSESRPVAVPERGEAPPQARPAAPPPRHSTPSSDVRDDRSAPPANVSPQRSERPSSAPPPSEAAPQSRQQGQASSHGKSRSDDARGKSHSQDNRGQSGEDDSQGEDGKGKGHGPRYR